MTDLQVRQLAEQWLASRGLADLSLYWPTNKPMPQIDYESGRAKPDLIDLLAAFASHTRREALREAAEAVEHVIVETYSTAESVAAHKHLNQAAAAIRLLAEEKK